MPLSLKHKIQLFNAVILGAVLVLLGTTFYFHESHKRLEEIDDSLDKIIPHLVASMLTYDRANPPERAGPRGGGDSFDPGGRPRPDGRPRPSNRPGPEFGGPLERNLPPGEQFHQFLLVVVWHATTQGITVIRNEKACLDFLSPYCPRQRI